MATYRFGAYATPCKIELRSSCSLLRGSSSQHSREKAYPGLALDHRATLCFRDFDLPQPSTNVRLPLHLKTTYSL